MHAMKEATEKLERRSLNSYAIPNRINCSITDCGTHIHAYA